MTYSTPAALRMALEDRLLTRSNESGVPLQRVSQPLLGGQIGGFGRRFDVVHSTVARSGSVVRKSSMIRPLTGPKTKRPRVSRDDSDEAATSRATRGFTARPGVITRHGSLRRPPATACSLHPQAGPNIIALFR